MPELGLKDSAKFFGMSKKQFAFKIFHNLIFKQSFLFKYFFLLKEFISMRVCVKFAIRLAILIKKSR